jgi:hypothetical protein
MRPLNARPAAACEFLAGAAWAWVVAAGVRAIVDPTRGLRDVQELRRLQETVNVSIRCDDEIGRGHDEEYSGHGNRNDPDVCVSGVCLDGQ